MRCEKHQVSNNQNCSDEQSLALKYKESARRRYELLREAVKTEDIMAGAKTIKDLINETTDIKFLVNDLSKIFIFSEKDKIVKLCLDVIKNILLNGKIYDKKIGNSEREGMIDSFVYEDLDLVVSIKSIWKGDKEKKKELLLKMIEKTFPKALESMVDEDKRRFTNKVNSLQKYLESI